MESRLNGLLAACTPQPFLARAEGLIRRARGRGAFRFALRDAEYLLLCRLAGSLLAGSRPSKKHFIFILLCIWPGQARPIESVSGGCQCHAASRGSLDTLF